MSDKMYYYAGAGLALGAGVGGAVAMLLYGLTDNTVFISFAGVGAALGLLLGAGIDMYHKNNSK